MPLAKGPASFSCVWAPGFPKPLAESHPSRGGSAAAPQQAREEFRRQTTLTSAYRPCLVTGGLKAAGMHPFTALRREVCLRGGRRTVLPLRTLREGPSCLSQMAPGVLWLWPRHIRLSLSPGGVLPCAPVSFPLLQNTGHGFRAPLNAGQFHLEIPN